VVIASKTADSYHANKQLVREERLSLPSLGERLRRNVKPEQDVRRSAIWGKMQIFLKQLQKIRQAAQRFFSQKK